MIIVVTGPECSGKSTLTKWLGRALNASTVAEQARSYLDELNRFGRYQPSDLLHICDAQMKAEQTATRKGGNIIADTDLQVLCIWWQERYGPIPHHLNQRYMSQSRRFYLLCRPDLPWVSDPQRESEYDRDRLFHLYQQDLERRGLKFEVVEGQGEPRHEFALNLCHRWLSADSA